MANTLTIRTDETLREALKQRAASQGKTVSEVVREILEQALLERPLASRVGHLRGGLQLPQPTPDSWQEQLAKRNWRE
jgi:plasmid stability protein